MSSGSLPDCTYHRAAQVGAGSFGSVLTVYNDDGEEYALKMFERQKIDEEDGEDDEGGDDDDSSSCPAALLDVGAMREISCLRLLRQDNGHVNIVQMVDIQSEWNDEEGAGTAGCLCMALPLFKSGSLAAAVENGFFKDSARFHKVHLAHGLLSAVAFLHDNGILHRDIKSDVSSTFVFECYCSFDRLHFLICSYMRMFLFIQNVLIQPIDDEDRHYPGQQWKAVLIDFSLAKPIDGTMFSSSITSTGKENTDSTTAGIDCHAIQHTGEVGTVSYTAPEVWRGAVEDKDGEAATGGGVYGKPMDLWSVGIVLLELVNDQMLESTKHAQSLRLVQELLQTRFSLDATNKPFPSILHGLLQVDPARRLSARQALQHDLFSKFQLDKFYPHVKLVSMTEALPLDLSHLEEDQEDEETATKNGASSKTSSSRSKQGSVKQKRLEKAKQQRLATIQRILKNELGDGNKNPLTVSAAFEYAQMMLQLDDELDNLSESSTLLDCIVLAFRFFEVEVLDLNGLDQWQDGPFANWTLQQYIDNESTIFMLMDYCLYPRTLQVISS
jgi:serine/threonine protein kinase